MIPIKVLFKEEDKLSIEAYVEKKRFYTVADFIRRAVFNYMRRYRASITGVPKTEKEMALKRFYIRSG